METVASEAALEAEVGLRQRAWAGSSPGRGALCAPRAGGGEADVLLADRGSTAHALWNPFKRREM